MHAPVKPKDTRVGGRTYPPSRRPKQATGALVLALACSGVSAMPAMDALAAHFSLEFAQASED